LTNAAPPTPDSSFLERWRALVSGGRRGPWPAFLRLLLWAASLPYGLAVRVRNLAYDRGWNRSFSADVPVVSVGNLTVGGAGKTPCVEYAAGFFSEREARVAILSRGYGSEAGGLNDEGLVLSENLPDVPAPLQGADRVELARIAVEELQSEVLVLDDGFQHRRLRRDLDVVLIDSTAPWGFGYLLPRGLLREPVSSLRRAGAVVLTRCDQSAPDTLAELREQVGRLAPGATVAETVHAPEGLVNEDAREGIHAVRDRAVAGFCGLGNPEGFRRTLLDLGARLTDFRSFPDHHAYTRDDVEGLRCWAGRQPHDALVLTTQKDLVKLRLRELAGRPLWAVRIRLAFRAGQAEFDALLRRVLGKGTRGGGSPCPE
jgi:tetraacyldisaccharide 4'-kinase